MLFCVAQQGCRTGAHTHVTCIADSDARPNQSLSSNMGKACVCDQLETSRVRGDGAARVGVNQAKEMDDVRLITTDRHSL